MITSFNAVGGYEQLIDKYRWTERVVGALKLSFLSIRVSEPLPEYVKYYNDSDGNRKSCSGVDQENFMHFLRPVDVGSGDLPWTGLLTGMFIR